MYWKEMTSGARTEVEYGDNLDGTAFSASPKDPLGCSDWNLAVRTLDYVPPPLTPPPPPCAPSRHTLTPLSTPSEKLPLLKGSVLCHGKILSRAFFFFLGKKWKRLSWLGLLPANDRCSAGLRRVAPVKS